MDCQKMDLIESLQRSVFKVRKVQIRLNLAVWLLLANFLKNGLITFLYVLDTASWG